MIMNKVVYLHAGNMLKMTTTNVLQNMKFIGH